MGGNIWVDSEPGCGSAFHFTIAAAVVSSEVDARRAMPVLPCENRTVSGGEAQTFAEPTGAKAF